MKESKHLVTKQYYRNFIICDSNNYMFKKHISSLTSNGILKYRRFVDLSRQHSRLHLPSVTANILPIFGIFQHCEIHSKGKHMGDNYIK